jgi:hypothetical protein
MKLVPAKIYPDEDRVRLPPLPRHSNPAHPLYYILVSLRSLFSKLIFQNNCRLPLRVSIFLAADSSKQLSSSSSRFHFLAADSSKQLSSSSSRLHFLAANFSKQLSSSSSGLHLLAANFQNCRLPLHVSNF